MFDCNDINWYSFFLTLCMTLFWRHNYLSALQLHLRNFFNLENSLWPVPGAPACAWHSPGHAILPMMRFDKLARTSRNALDCCFKRSLSLWSNRRGIFLSGDATFILMCFASYRQKLCLYFGFILCYRVGLCQTPALAIYISASTVKWNVSKFFPFPFFRVQPLFSY